MTLVLGDSDKELLMEHEQQAARAFDELAPQVGAGGLRESFTSSEEPFFVSVVVGLATFFLKRLDAYEGGPWVKKDVKGNILHIAFPNFNPKTTVSALNLSLRVAAQIYPKELKPLFPKWLVQQNTMEECAKFLKLGKRNNKHRTVREVQLSLNRRKIPWFHLGAYSGKENLIQVGYGRYQHLLDRTVSFESSQIGIAISMDKSNSQQFLADLGFPVTKQVVAPDVDGAIVAADLLGYPVVVKPACGTHGFNVHVNLRGANEVRQAFNTILESRRKSGRTEYNPIIVEEHVMGQDYRLSMVGGQLLEALHRMPAQVTGDGEHSVLELVELENQNPLRGDKNSMEATYLRLELSAPELAALKKQGLSTSSVPSVGQTVLLRENANWSSGGKFEYITERVHPDNVSLAARMAEAMKIDLMGVDVIVNDISESYLKGGLRVIEVNHNPGICGTRDEQGYFHERGGAMIDLLAPLAVKQLVPVIVVAESQVSQELTKSLGVALSGEGLVPGVVNQSGMFVKGELWSNPESLDYSDPALPVLRNKEIDAAVIEQSFRTLLDRGIGTGGCDIGVVLSISGDEVMTEVWRDGIAPARAAEMLMKVSRKAAVVLVDDPEVASCAKQVDASRLCVLSLNGASEDLDQLISEGAKAVILESISQHSMHIRIVSSHSGGDASGKQVQISADASDKGKALIILALLGILMSLDYPLESSLSRLEDMFCSTIS